MAKSKKKTQAQTKTKPQIDKKQVILGVIIFLVACLFLGYSFYEMSAKNTPQNGGSIQQKTAKVEVEESQPEIIEVERDNVALKIKATAEKDFALNIYYTQDWNEDFNEENHVSTEIKSGTHTYAVDLPVKYIARIRIHFAPDAGKIDVKQLALIGTQIVDLIDITQYEILQFENIEINEDKSFSFTALPGDDAYILYRPGIAIPEEFRKKSENNNQETTEEVVEEANPENVSE